MCFADRFSVHCVCLLMVLRYGTLDFDKLHLYVSILASVWHAGYF